VIVSVDHRDFRRGLGGGEREEIISINIKIQHDFPVFPAVN
jgi:hypothetical protein